MGTFAGLDAEAPEVCPQCGGPSCEGPCNGAARDGAPRPVTVSGYNCLYCGESFTGDNAISLVYDHTVAMHPAPAPVLASPRSAPCPPSDAHLKGLIERYREARSGNVSMMTPAIGARGDILDGMAYVREAPWCELMDAADALVAYLESGKGTNNG